MRPTLSEADLLLGQKALDDLLRARTARGLTQPILAVVEAAAGVVQDYTARYDLAPERWRRLVRGLAVYDLMNFPGGAVPAEVARAHDAALAELAAILAGKFADLLPANPAPPPNPAPRIAAGSDPQVPVLTYLPPLT